MRKEYLFAFLLVVLYTVSYAQGIEDNSSLPSDNHIPQNNNLPPPHPLAPKADTDPTTGSDRSTSSYPDTNSNMDTVQTQSIGTSGDYHHRSHPLQLDKLPNPDPNK